MKKIKVILISCLCLLMMTGCTTNKIDSQKIKIVCTTYVQYDWLQQIIGKENSTFDLSLIIKNGVDLHNYQPTVQDIVQISSADLFVCIGGESEAWVNDAIKEAKNKDVKMISLMDVLKDHLKEEEHLEGIEEHDHDHESEDETEYDEHLWLSLKNAHQAIEFLSNEIQKTDQKHKDIYQKNTENYLKKIDDLQQQYQRAVDASKTKALVFADRFPFRYLMNDYSLNYYAAFPGCSAETEASFSTVTFLASKIDELDLSYVIVVDQSDKKMAKTIINCTKNKNQKIVTLDSLQAVKQEQIDKGYSYLKAMKHNLKVLKKCLE